jgi:small redox-active disulfide protein 2
MKKIQILGTGCPKCRMLAEHAEAAAKELGIEYEMVKVSDINDILDFGVIMTPALAVDGEVKLIGNASSVENIKELIQSVD